MELALDVLHRALQGDDEARSFLDRTSSVYVLDASDSSNPKTYGCWNFIHQAMNEMERAETSSSNGATSPRQAALEANAQLLANMALRAARRSNNLDREMVSKCITSSKELHNSQQEVQRLLEINVEIRGIVMGRLAALALDPSLTKGHHRHTSTFSNPVVMESFCAVLAANAVSNGPGAIRHFVSEWILPSSTSLPPLCLASTTLHLAREAARESAPAGTQDALQHLSTVVMAGVLVPVFVGAIKGGDENEGSAAGREFKNRVAALSLRAVNSWCSETDLSVAQIKHICSKVQIDVVDALSDAMYSDSNLVIDALADLIESLLERHRVPTVSPERMTQARYIMQVDEAAFRSNISESQLVVIESKEMVTILEELVSAIGLQRYRFVDRQAKGDHEVCRNLTRIAAAVCVACTELSRRGLSIQLGPGPLDLLLKSASHPSVNICGIALEFMKELLPSEPGLGHQLLPTLQRRAIAPHCFVHGTVPSLSSNDLEGAQYQEFAIFRETILADCLLACWRAGKEAYMSSCAAAIEEFCTSNATSKASFHLEAALFCVGAVAEEAMVETPSSLDTPYLQRCTVALALKPESLSSNPLTLNQACNFISKYHKWYCCKPVEGVLDVATDLALSTFSLCATVFPKEAVCIEMKREGNVSPYRNAARALEGLLSRAPQHFVSSHAIEALGGGWEASYAAANLPGILESGDRKAICSGLCHVLASMPENQRDRSLLALAMPTLDCLETMMTQAGNLGNAKANTEQFNAILDRAASEISLVTTMTRVFTDAAMQTGQQDTPRGRTLTEPAMAIIQRAWPSISRAGSQFSHLESVSTSLGSFLSNCLPSECQNDQQLSFIQETFAIVDSMVPPELPLQPAVDGAPHTMESTERSLAVVLDFMETFVKRYGAAIDTHAETLSQGNDAKGGTAQAERAHQLGVCLERVLLEVVARLYQALESVRDKTKAASNLALASLFCVLKACAVTCPIFLLHLPDNQPGQPVQQDRKLLDRSFESATAVLSLPQSDTQTLLSAMEFLEGTVSLRTPQSTGSTKQSDVGSVLSLQWSRVRPSLISAMVSGICGNWSSSSSLEGAASLLRTWLIVEVKCSVSSPATMKENQELWIEALSVESQFVLGSDARSVVLECLVKVARGEVTTEALLEFLQSVWGLHQAESRESLEQSDAVVKFCRKFS